MQTIHTPIKVFMIYQQQQSSKRNKKKIIAQACFGED